MLKYKFSILATSNLIGTKAAFHFIANRDGKITIFFGKAPGPAHAFTL